MQKARQDAKEAVRNFATVVRILITNKQFRNLVVDGVDIAHSLIKKRIKKEETHRDPKEDSEKEMNLITDRLVQWIHDAKSQPEFKNSFLFLLHTAADWKSRVQSKQLPEEHKQLGRNAKELLESWIGNGYSLDNLIVSVDATVASLGEEKTLDTHLGHLEEFIQRSLTDKEFTEDKEEYRIKAQSIVTDTKALLQEVQNKEPLRKAMHEIYFLGNKIKHDPSRKVLEKDLEKIIHDLFYDQSGNLTVKPELFNDLFLVLPVLVEKMQVIPIKTLDLSDDSMDLVLSDIVINRANVRDALWRIEFIASHVPGSSETEIVMEIMNIRAEMANVRFKYAKKGLVGLTDEGLADLVIYDKGMEVAMLLKPQTVEHTVPSVVIHETETQVSVEEGVQPQRREKRRLLKADRVKCIVHKLNVRVHDSKHDFLYSLLKPVLRKVVKQKIEEAVEAMLTELVWDLNEQVHSVANRLQSMGTQ